MVARITSSKSMLKNSVQNDLCAKKSIILVFKALHWGGDSAGSVNKLLW